MILCAGFVIDVLIVIVPIRIFSVYRSFIHALLINT